MRRLSAYVTLVVAVAAVPLLMSCAPYKQLQPKPELQPAEGTYIPLQRSEKDFELKEGKKYYIEFPSSNEDNYYLVLNNPQKKQLKTFLTASLTDGKHPGAPVDDQAVYADTQSAYPIGISPPVYYWIIDKVTQDMVVSLRYRYVPRWRYRFETRFIALKEIYESSVVERALYEAMGPGHDLSRVDYGRALDTVGAHSARLDKVLKELLEIESLFPQKLLQSADPAYQAYRDFKSKLEEEIAFQRNYALTLGVLQQVRKSGGRALDFLGGIDSIIAYFGQKDALPRNVVACVQSVIQTAMEQVTPFYDAQLQTKSNEAPFEADIYRFASYRKLDTLYAIADMRMPPDLAQQFRFMVAFQDAAVGFAALRDSLKAFAEHIKQSPPLPDDQLFGQIVSRTSALEAAVPRQLDQGHGKYLGLVCSQKLNAALTELSTRLSRRISEYRLAQAMVPQLNALRAQRDISGMLAMLKANAHLEFLTDKYRPLDTMLIHQQQRLIRDALQAASWWQAEDNLRKLHTEQNFIDPASAAQRATAVLTMEDSLYITVERVTRARVMRFLDERINQLTDIDSLYADSAFYPVHEIAFSSGGRAQLYQRKEQLVADLARMKENEFPMRAVRLMYDEFIKNPTDSGVHRARAIVAHGKHYTGDDQETKMRIAECDPTLAKWITRPKQYRRVFALPTTDNEQRGQQNTYMVRFNLRIKTEAMFPVYDVNIKLPKWLVENAASEQWYDKIRLNRKEMRNEGRFTISAPTAANDYECQMTPVQMDKDGHNILEITFTRPVFGVVPVSVMVQPPIIKKN